MYTLAFDDTALSGRDLEHDLRRGQARHHRLHRVGNLARRASGLRPERGEPVNCVAPCVGHDEAVPRLEEPARHVEAHLAKPNEADIHAIPPCARFASACAI